MSDQLGEAELTPAPVCRKWGGGAVLREILGNRGRGNRWWHVNHLLTSLEIQSEMLSCLGVLHSVAC